MLISIIFENKRRHLFANFLFAIKKLLLALMINTVKSKYKYYFYDKKKNNKNIKL